MSQSNIPTTFVLAPNLLSPSVPQVEAPKPGFPPPNFLADEALADVRWSIGGALLYDNAVIEFLKFIRSETPAIRIRDVFGAPPSRWTLDWYATRRLIPPGDFTAAAKKIIELQVDFSLDFDNPFIAEDRLDDVVGNTCLRSLSTVRNARIYVASDILADYIRKQFPQFKLHAGANKVVAENGQGDSDYYCRSAEKFETTVLHANDATDSAFLEKLVARVPADKFEIVVNDTCLRNCPLRREHLDALSKIRNAPWDASLLQQRHTLLGRAGCENVIASPGNPAGRASMLTREEMKRAYALGFRNFKIQAEKLRSEVAFFWELGQRILSDNPEYWHKKSAFIASAVNNIHAPVPVLKSGTGAFVLRKYD